MSVEQIVNSRFFGKIEKWREKAYIICQLDANYRSTGTVGVNAHNDPNEHNTPHTSEVS